MFYGGRQSLSVIKRTQADPLYLPRRIPICDGLPLLAVEKHGES